MKLKKVLIKESELKVNDFQFSLPSQPMNNLFRTDSGLIKRDLYNC